MCFLTRSYTAFLSLSSKRLLKLKCGFSALISVPTSWMRLSLSELHLFGYNISKQSGRIVEMLSFCLNFLKTV